MKKFLATAVLIAELFVVVRPLTSSETSPLLEQVSGVNPFFWK